MARKEGPPDETTRPEEDKELERVVREIKKERPKKPRRKKTTPEGQDELDTLVQEIQAEREPKKVEEEMSQEEIEDEMQAVLEEIEESRKETTAVLTLEEEEESERELERALTEIEERRVAERMGDAEPYFDLFELFRKKQERARQLARKMWGRREGADREVRHREDQERWWEEISGRYQEIGDYSPADRAFLKMSERLRSQLFREWSSFLNESSHGATPELQERIASILRIHQQIDALWDVAKARQQKRPELAEKKVNEMDEEQKSAVAKARGEKSLGTLSAQLRKAKILDEKGRVLINVPKHKVEKAAPTSQKQDELDEIAKQLAESRRKFEGEK